MQKVLKSKYLALFSLVSILCISLCLSIVVVHAGSFTKTSKMFSGIDNSIYISDDDYPYNTAAGPSTPEEDAAEVTVTHVSLDIVYGVKKGLVQFHGEVPFAETHKKDGTALNGWSGYYAQEGTYIVDELYEDGTDVSASVKGTYQYGHTPTDYWGDGTDAAEYYSSKNFKSVGAAQSINKDEVKSLRLYALEKTGGDGFWFFMRNLGYMITQGLAYLATMFVSLVVKAKNISTDTILEALHLEDVGKMLTKNFIGGDTIGLSPFTAFCIIMFIFAVAGYAIRWMKGAQKTTGLWNILGTGAIGLIVIGVSLTNHWSDLGSTISNAAAKILYVTTESFSETDGDAFKIEIDDDDNTNYITQLSELAMIYKPYIDAQLCTQFGVSSVEKLDMTTLGVDSYTADLVGFTTTEDFNNNLGYYFWFADSSAKKKVEGNKEMPGTNAGAAEEKLASMFTALQKTYNNTTDDSQKTDILNVVDSFADPHTVVGAVLMLAITIVMILLGIVLLKYAINVLIAKLELFVALLGMVIAGPLIVTNNKKLVHTGKSILGMLLISFLEVTVWGLVFDVIIYTVAIMLEATIIRVLVTIGFLLLFLKLNPYIHEKIKQLLDNTTRAVSPEFHQARNAAKQRLRRLANDAVRDYDDKKKFAGYDAEGNAIMESRKGGAISMLLHGAANSLENADNRKSARKITQEAKEARKGTKTASNRQIRQAAENQTKQVEQFIESDAVDLSKQIDAEANKAYNDTIEYDEFGNKTGFNLDKLDADEQEMALDISTLKDEEKELMNDDEYRALVREQKEINALNENLAEGEEPKEMSAEKIARLQELEDNIRAKRKLISAKEQALGENVRRRTKIQSAQSHKIAIDENAEDIDAAIKTASRIAAQQKHEDELRLALQDEINAHALDSENLADTNGKIGAANKRLKVNTDAVNKQTIATLKLQQLENQEAIDSKAAVDKAKVITEQIERDSRKLIAKAQDALNEAPIVGQDDAAIKAAKQRVKDARGIPLIWKSEEKKAAKRDLANLQETMKRKKEVLSDQSHTKKAVTNADAAAILGGTITEQINAMSKHGDAMNLRSKEQLVSEAVTETRQAQKEIRQAGEQMQKQTEDSIRQTINATTADRTKIAQSVINSNEDTVDDTMDTSETIVETENVSRVEKEHVDTQPVTQPINQTMNQPMTQSMPQPAKKKVADTHPTSEPAPKQQIHKKVVNETVYKQTSTPNPTQNAVNSQVQEPTPQPVAQPVSQPTHNPVSQPTNNSRKVNMAKPEVIHETVTHTNVVEQKVPTSQPTSQPTAQQKSNPINNPAPAPAQPAPTRVEDTINNVISNNETNAQPAPITETVVEEVNEVHYVDESNRPISQPVNNHAPKPVSQPAPQPKYNPQPQPKSNPQPQPKPTQQQKQASAPKPAPQPTKPAAASTPSTAQSGTPTPSIKINWRTKRAVSNIGTYGGVAEVRQKQAAEADQRLQTAQTAEAEARARKESALSKQDAKQAKVDQAIAKQQAKAATRDMKAAEKHAEKATKKVEKANARVAKTQDKIINKGIKKLERDQKSTFIQTDEIRDSFEARSKSIIAEQERLSGVVTPDTAPATDDFDIDTSKEDYAREAQAIQDALDTGDYSTLFNNNSSDD